MPSHKFKDESWSLKSLLRESKQPDSQREIAVGVTGELRGADMKSTGGRKADEKPFTSTVLVKGTRHGTVILRRRLEQPLKTPTSSEGTKEPIEKSITAEKSESSLREIPAVTGVSVTYQTTPRP